MYNYDNEYTQPNFESDYEFNDHESDFEAGNFETGNYETNDHEYDMEENYESDNEFFRPQPSPNSSIRQTSPVRPPVINAPLRNLFGQPRTVVVPTRPGTPAYRPAYAPYRPPYIRPATSIFGRPPVNPYRPWGSPYRPSYQYNRYGNTWNRNHPSYNRYGNNWNRPHPWHNRYSSPSFNSSNVNSSFNTGMPGSVEVPAPQPFGSSAGSSFAAPSSSSFGSAAPSASTDPAIMDTLRSLSQQIAATNANVASLQNTLAQQDHSGSMPPPDMPPPAGAGAPPAPSAGVPPSSEFEMGDYEYDMENEMMNYEGNENEMDEMQMAAELLNVSNESELDQFLGINLKKILGGLGKTLGIQLPPQFSSLFKSLAPVLAGAFGGPGAAMLAKSVTGEVFGLELEGLSQEDQEFETARAFVRLANDAMKELAENPGTGDHVADAKNALIQSAKQNAPGLLVEKRNHHGKHGHWHRRGNKIVVEHAY